MRMFSSVVQDVFNFGTRIAAADNSGSTSMPPKPFCSLFLRAYTRGLQYLEVIWILSSLEMRRLRVGRSHLYTDLPLEDTGGFGDWGHGPGILIQEGNINWI